MVKPIRATAARGRSGSTLPALLAGAMMLLVAACGGPDGNGGGAAGAEKVSERAAVSRAVVTMAPKDGADDVDTTGALKVTAGKGKLTSVRVEDREGNRVEGEITAGGTAWKPSRALWNSTEYTVEAVARDAAGRETTERSTFTTVAAKDTFIGHFTPEDGDTVGVGMEVSLSFDHAITDRKAVEEAVRVTASPSVPVEGHWFGDRRLDFRPEKYWAKGTKITLSLRLKGVEGAEGVYGTQSKDVRYTVGRSQVSTVDAARKTMTVVRDGKTIRTIPITAGAPSTTTYNGQMVITEKYEVTRMNGETVGFGGEYDIEDVPHAMRLTTSGTFIHGNYWASPGTFGSANVSHGCVGLRDLRGGGDHSTPAAWFFDHSIIGDVVVVKNSKDKQVAPDNGLNGWNMSWREWTADR